MRWKRPKKKQISSRQRPLIGFRTLLTLALLLGGLSYVFLISPSIDETGQDQAFDKKSKPITWFETADKRRKALSTQQSATDAQFYEREASSSVTEAEKALTRADSLLNRERRLVDLERENARLRKRLDEQAEPGKLTANQCQREGDPFALAQNESQLLLSGSLVGARFVNNVSKSVDLTVNGIAHRLHVGGIAPFNDNNRLCRIGLLGIVNNITARFAVICCEPSG